jgi:hypothetical protein
MPRAHVVDALVKGMDREPTKKIDDIVAFIGKEAQRLASAWPRKTPPPTARPCWRWASRCWSRWWSAW